MLWRKNNFSCTAPWPVTQTLKGNEKLSGLVRNLSYQGKFHWNLEIKLREGKFSLSYWGIRVIWGFTVNYCLKQVGIKDDNCYLKNICYQNQTSTAKEHANTCIMNIEAATYISFLLGNNFEWIIIVLKTIIMQLSRGLDPHNSSQNSDSKLNANRICENQYNFHS